MTDTTGAIYGQIAGAYYGESGIPENWKNKLAKFDLIRDMADKLLHNHIFPGNMMKSYSKYNQILILNI